MRRRCGARRARRGPQGRGRCRSVRALSRRMPGPGVSSRRPRPRAREASRSRSTAATRPDRRRRARTAASSAGVARRAEHARCTRARPELDGCPAPRARRAARPGARRRRRCSGPAGPCRRARASPRSATTRSARRGGRATLPERSRGCGTSTSPTAARSARRARRAGTRAAAPRPSEMRPTAGLTSSSSTARVSAVSPHEQPLRDLARDRARVYSRWRITARIYGGGGRHARRPPLRRSFLRAGRLPGGGGRRSRTRSARALPRSPAAPAP